MAHTRRKFLKIASMSALFSASLEGFASLASAQSSVAPEPTGHSSRANAWTIKTYSGYEGTTFLIQQSHGAGVPVKLHRVTDHRRSNGAGLIAADEPQCFSLVFRGSHSHPIEQGVYELSHDAIGQVSLFLVPVVSRDVSALYFQSIINQGRP